MNRNFFVVRSINSVYNEFQFTSKQMMAAHNVPGNVVRVADLEKKLTEKDEEIARLKDEKAKVSIQKTSTFYS